MNRRSFLGALGATTVGGLGGWDEATAAPAKGNWRIGCYTRPFDKSDYRVAFDAIAEAGYRYVGFMTTNTEEWVMIGPDTPEAVASKMGDEARQRDLEVLSVYGVFSAKESVSSGVDELKRLIDRCRACGSPDLLLGGVSDPAQSEAYYQVVEACCDYAGERQVRMTIKPHGGSNGTGPACRKLIEQVGHPSFKLWYDPGNIFYYSDGELDPVDDAATVDGLVAGMCVKDYVHPKEVMVTPGTGRVDFPRVLARLRQGGFTSGPLIVECVKRGDLASTTSEARRARLFVESLLAREAVSR